MTKTLQQLSEKMRDIDFAMLATHTKGGAIAARPMSNNREVDYDGDAWFFSDGDTLMVADISNDPAVTLTYPWPSTVLPRDRGPRLPHQRQRSVRGALDPGPDAMVA